MDIKCIWGYFPGKMCRIDIEKVYPYHDKAFTMIYFTENGYFNRAMYYMKQAKHMKLSDCGFIPYTL